MSRFWADFPDIKERLEQTANFMTADRRTGLKSFDLVLEDLMQATGKMLRPGLVFIGANTVKSVLTDVEKKQLVALAASIETIHLATLVHDDIVDESKIRRGKPSVQSRYGKDYAVYTGDFLLTRALVALAEHQIDQSLMTQMTLAVQRICISEMRQFDSRYSFDMGIKRYLHIISGKTAALFAASLTSGAGLIKGEEKHAKALARIGYAIGMAFQIQDDLLDIGSDQVTLKKDVLSDIRQGYVTLPILLGIKLDKTGLLMQQLSSEAPNIEIILSTLKSNGALEATEAMAKRYIARAIKQLERLPENAGKWQLERFIPLLLDRNN